MTVAQYEARQAALPGLRELRARNAPVPDVNQELERSFTRLERVAIWVTDRVGTMGFFFVIAAWTILWLSWNTVGPQNLRFDPGPAFVLWLFISNLIQLHLMPLIMVGQNLQDRYSELRSEADFQINLNTEAEVETILAHLDNQDHLMLEILRRVDQLQSSKTTT